MTARPTTEELNAALREAATHCQAVVDRVVKGRAVNLSFARRKGVYGKAPDFRAQLVGRGTPIERGDP